MIDILSIFITAFMLVVKNRWSSIRLTVCRGDRCNKWRWWWTSHRFAICWIRSWQQRFTWKKRRWK